MNPLNGKIKRHPGYSEHNVDPMVTFALPLLGKPNFLPNNITVANFPKYPKFCVVTPAKDYKDYSKQTFFCESSVKKNEQGKDVTSNLFVLMIAKCTKDSLDCKFYGPGRHPIGRITSIKPVANTKGVCAVEYRQGQTVESTILPCEIKDNNIKLELVQARCREHNNELTCDYQYLPSMECDCDGPNACNYI